LDSEKTAKWAESRVDLLFLGAAFAAFLIPTFIAPLTYPAFYEDESWLYLSSFEALRGNGFSLAALGEGQSYALVFSLIVWPFLAASPLDPELTIRLIHTGASLGTMVAAFVIARRLAPRSAVLAPVLIVMLPLTYTTLRYGRVEAVAAWLGLSAIATALGGSALLAGALSALAVCVHPIMIWIGAPCFVAIVQRSGWVGVGRYTIGGALGILPQALWMIFFSDVSSKYWVTSSVAPGRNVLLESLITEPQRYANYVAGLNPVDIAMQVALLAGLTLVSIVAARQTNRWFMLAIVAAPLAALALFSLGKNPYYFVIPLCALTIAAAYGARWLPRPMLLTVCACALAYVGWRHVPEAWASRDDATVTQVTRAIASDLPNGAIVFTPLRYAGLLRSRPDLRLYSYHALYAGDASTEMISCKDLDRHIADLADTDPRPSSAALRDDIREAELVMYGMTWEAYLNSVFHPDPPDFECLTNPTTATRSALPVCVPAGGAECGEIDIVRRPIAPQATDGSGIR